jgi:hypothetical protein
MGDVGFHGPNAQNSARTLCHTKDSPANPWSQSNLQQDSDVIRRLKMPVFDENLQNHAQLCRNSGKYGEKIKDCFGSTYSVSASHFRYHWIVFLKCSYRILFLSGSENNIQ